ncbi:hypothetical protein Pint_01581 [Pistacia integerrima]|uniref:Uncharacterized protein n=1 Tax=Pistacia integerrima TaxID=434235 RepID=A0ACC0ZP22_9ROSI|nr:hypothetical protein Pint_01581 [Pistacia integerrima]
MDRYQKVEKPKPESPINENEIRITTLGAIRNYITYATTLLQVYVWAVSRQLSLPPLFFSALLVICWSYAITMVKSGLMLSEWLRVIEKRGKEIVLKAMGQAINKTVAIAEIIKKRIPRLHQDTAISSVSITDIWEPIEEGLVPVEMTRHVSMISITLSARELNKDSPGYQAPSYVEPPKPQYRYQYQQQQQPPRQGRIPYNVVNEDSYGRGQGRGRGRGRGFVRGGYGHYQENDGYSNWGRGGGRGRGGGYRGTGYERGRGGGGRGYGRGRGRMGAIKGWWLLSNSQGLVFFSALAKCLPWPVRKILWEYYY